MYSIKIVSTGLGLPDRIQTSAELAPLINRSEHWIVSRTGIRERRIAEEPMDVLAARACKEALGGVPPDCILNASTTPLQLIPDSSVFIQRELGYTAIPAWSIHSTCLSFLVAMHSAAAMIQGGSYKRILIVSSETGTPWRNLQEPESAALFGDGAAAVVLEATPASESSAWLDWEMNTFNEGAELTEFRGAGTKHPPGHPVKTSKEDNLFSMQGTRIYRFARAKVKETLGALLQRTRLLPTDFDWVIPHQASGHAVEAASEYGFSADKVVNIVGEYGNCIAASMPIALATAHKRGWLKRDDLVLMGGTGAGLSVAFAVIRF